MEFPGRRQGSGFGPRWKHLESSDPTERALLKSEWHRPLLSPCPDPRRRHRAQIAGLRGRPVLFLDHLPSEFKLNEWRARSLALATRSVGDCCVVLPRQHIREARAESFRHRRVCEKRRGASPTENIETSVYYQQP